QCHLNPVAHLRGRRLALPRRRQAVDPGPGQEPAQEQKAEQDVGGVGEQAGLQDQRGEEQQQDAEEPPHWKLSSPPSRPACFVGTATSPRISLTSEAGVILRSRLSGRRISRWPSTGSAMRLTSSGNTKFRPATAASAWAVRNSASDARGLPPR